MTKSPVRFIFVIPFYNQDEYIKECLKSIEINSHEDIKIIVINNSDRQTDINQIYKEYKNMTIINTNKNLGFSMACNLGAKIAIQRGAEYIICLNQDTIICERFLSEIIKPFMEKEDIVLAAPIHYTYDGRSIEPIFIRWYLTQCPDLIVDALDCKLKTFYEVEYISGACFAIKTEFIKKYGFFDPIYFMYSEDEDLCRRVRYLGYRIVIVPRAKFRHYHSHTQADEKDKRRIRLWRRNSTAIFLLKNIREPIWKAMARLIYNYLIDYVSYIMRFRIGSILINMWWDMKLIYLFPKILKSRKNELRYINSKLDFPREEKKCGSKGGIL